MSSASKFLEVILPFIFMFINTLHCLTSLLVALDQPHLKDNDFLLSLGSQRYKTINESCNNFQ